MFVMSSKVNDKIPDYVLKELDSLLRLDGEDEIANSLTQVRIVARCKCEDSECSSFWTMDISELPVNLDRWRQIILLGEGICYCLDVVDEKLAYVEVVHPDKRLHHHLIKNCEKVK
jgi:hypothetical protein